MAQGWFEPQMHVRNFAQYDHLRWGFRTPKWEHKSGAENYFPFEFELQN